MSTASATEEMESLSLQLTAASEAQYPPHPELARAREVFRYLEPWEANFQRTLFSRPPPDQGAPDTPSAEPVVPKGCDDTALAAFAQLGALRLDAQRCLISLVSRDLEHILAESTRTLSLQSDLVHSERDSLWMGSGSFPREEGLSCDSLPRWRKMRDRRPPPQEDGHYYTDGMTQHWHVISDMRQHEELHQRMFVQRAKELRFYAAVPIRTPSGTVIGTYAVLDDKPRYGVSAAEMEFLDDIADTVMAHLEAKRAMAQRKRGDRLIKGLALFNGGKASLREWWLSNHGISQRGEGQRRRRTSPSSEEEHRQERADEEFGMTYRAEDLDDRGRLPAQSHTAPPPLPPSNDADTTSGDTTMVDGTDSAANAHSPTRAKVVASEGRIARVDHADTFDIGKEIERVFARASNLIRESISAEGVMFVDTDYTRSRKDRSGRYAKNTKEHESPATSSTELDSDDMSKAGSTYSKQSHHHSKGNHHSSDPADQGSCPLLGFSTKVRSSLRGFSPSNKQSSLPKTVMNRLLRRYPQGKVFNYYQGAPLSTSSGGEAPSDIAVQEVMAKTRRLKNKENQDAHDLMQIMPDSRSVLFLPLWDTRRERWRSGILIWNCAPNRFLDVEEDVTYLSAFGNSLVAELARLDAVAADQAKATFISSVSHELRTPLHGVLAGVEFLQESNLNIYQQELATTISMAGRTLLDTINNILDFTKINSFTDAQRTDRKDRDANRNMAFKSADWGEVGVTSNINLAQLTENVVDTVVTANQFQASLKAQGARVKRGKSAGSSDAGSADGADDPEALLVVLDLAKQPSWQLSISPGSWTRIITNLLGNAFKYTKAGTITVRLVAGKTHKSGKTEITLMVEDTGQGMSHEYLRHHLYTPFMQENTHASGTGLGLSIVKQIIEDIGGTIAIESEVGRGTKIKVSLLAEILPAVEDTLRAPGVKLGLAAPPARSEQQRHERQLRIQVAKTCSDWLGSSCETLSATTKEADIELCIMTERDYEVLSEEHQAVQDVPILVLTTHTEITTQRVVKDAPDNVIYVNQPFGPQKMSRALTAALEQSRRRRPAQNGTAKFSLPLSLTGSNLAMSQSEHRREERDPIPKSSRNGESKTPRDRVKLFRPPPGLQTSSSASIDSSTREPKETFRRSSTETDAPGTDASSPMTNRSDSTGSPDSALGKILLVEDNNVNMKLLVNAMRKLRRPCEQAENGLEALNAYTSSPPGSFKLVLMDISMPVMDGFMATERIRIFERKNGWPRCKIFALTGVASQEARQRAETCGIDAFFTKPVSMVKLRGIVQDMEDM